MRIRPFRALRPTPELVSRVASVPYDTISSDEARELAVGNPDSFLHVIRPEIDLPADTHIHSDEVYSVARRNLLNLRTRGVLVQEEEPCLYVYRQKTHDHVQSGIVACCRLDDYEAGTIRKHERTRPDKEQDRTRHILTLGAHTGPVFLTYQNEAAIDRQVADIQRGTPLLALTAPDGVEHTVWRVVGGDPLVAAFEAVGSAYIADGHHRSAAAACARRELGRGSQPSGDRECDWFLAVMFGANQLRILPYNRHAHDLNERSEADFLTGVRERFNVVERVSAVPRRHRQISMYLGGAWYGLSWPRDDGADPVAALDVSVLQERLLAPVLGIGDPRTSNRIAFIGGIRGTRELERMVDTGGGVAFSLFPVTVDQMMAIADAGRIMPPKSTWFEPKLRSGLFVHLLED